MPPILEEQKKSKKTKARLIVCLALLVLVCVVCFISYTPQRENDTIIHVSKKDTVTSISMVLKNEGVIKNTSLFKGVISILYRDKKISTGDYKFSKNSSFAQIVWQLVTSNHKIDPIKVTIREGLDNEEIAGLLDSKISNFDKNLFLSKTVNLQGYLFPDTYFFFPLSTTEEIIDEMSGNFEKRIEGLDIDLSSSSKKLEDIVIMASILEGEAKGSKDNEMISGILWKRLALGIPLQVDVDKTTYTSKGLPEKPLNNPGLSSIKAAMNPKTSNYLFYLHDKNGEVHYASDYTDHKKNINLYLK